MPANLSLALAFFLIGAAASASAVEDAIELETTRIIANEELPGLIYLVPWKDVKASRVDSQKLALHDFFGDLYDPVVPSTDGGEITN